MKIPAPGLQVSGTRTPDIKNGNLQEVIINTGNVNEKNNAEFVNGSHYGIFALDLLWIINKTL